MISAKSVSVSLSLIGIGIAIGAKHVRSARGVNIVMVLFTIVEIAAIGITILGG